MLCFTPNNIGSPLTIHPVATYSEWSRYHTIVVCAIATWHPSLPLCARGQEKWWSKICQPEAPSQSVEMNNNLLTIDFTKLTNNFLKVTMKWWLHSSTEYKLCWQFSPLADHFHLYLNKCLDLFYIHVTIFFLIPRG